MADSRGRCRQGHVGRSTGHCGLGVRDGLPRQAQHVLGGGSWPPDASGNEYDCRDAAESGSKGSLKGGQRGAFREYDGVMMSGMPRTQVKELKRVVVAREQVMTLSVEVERLECRVDLGLEHAKATEAGGRRLSSGRGSEFWRRHGSLGPVLRMPEVPGLGDGSLLD